jgi:D-aminoacyl-tRNA deacylase
LRVLLQRVSRANVTIGDRVAGKIERGLLLLVGYTTTDDESVCDWMVDKVLGLRIFPDEEGRMNRSVEEIGGGVLVVSQFTLYGDASRGRRPSFVTAARPEHAIPLYERCVERLRSSTLEVATGEFGAMMAVELVNEGPVTILLEREGPGATG